MTELRRHVARAAFFLLLTASVLASVAYVVTNNVIDDLLLNLIANFTFIPISFFLAYWYFQWGRGWRVYRRYRRLAMTDPEVLLPGATRRLRRIERTDLYRNVAAELLANPPGIPHVLLGKAGSGKTTALQGLITDLAQQNLVPVVVPRYSYEGLANLRSLLRDGFLAAVDQWLQSDSQGDALWRNLHRSGRIVAVIDGMDDWRARQGIGPSNALHILSSGAHAAGVRTVVALRSDRQSLDEPFPAFPLDSLEVSPDDVERRVAAYPTALTEEHRKAFQDALGALDVAEAPLFLELASQSLFDLTLLQAVRALPTLYARFTLFDGWLEHQCRKSTGRNVEVAGTLDTNLARLELIAALMSGVGRLQVTNADLADPGQLLPGVPEMTRSDVASAQRLGQYLTILDVSCDPWESQQMSFVHSLVQSLMTARFLRRNPERVRPLATTGSSAESLTALTYLFSHPSHHEHLEAAQLALLDAARSRHREVGVANLRLLVSLGRPSDTIAERALQLGAGLFPLVPDSLQVQVIDAVAALPTTAKYPILWDWSIVGVLAVGSRAGRVLMDGGSESFALLREEIVDLVERGSAVRLHEAASPGWPEFGGKVTMLSVLLPQWADIATGAEAVELRRLTAMMVTLAEAGQIGGVEASIIAGFYGALRRNIKSRCRVHLPALQNALRTHDARLDLAQIATILLRHDSGARDAWAMLDGLGSTSEHPFVRRAARLGIKSAQRRPRVRGEVVWRGGEQSAPRSGARLAPEAHQLLADSHLLALLENQHNSGSAAARDRRDRSWIMRELPPCLGTSPDRAELFTGCRRDCSWGLCPLDEEFIARLRAVPFSSAFVLHERELTKQYRRRWNPRFFGPRSAAFWDRLDAAFDVGRQRSGT